MQGIVTLVWTLGPVSTRQLAIDHVRVEGRMVSADSNNPFPFTKIADYPPTDANAPTGFDGQAIIQNVDPGDWEYQGIPVDVAGNEGPARSVVVTMAADVPSQLAALDATAS